MELKKKRKTRSKWSLFQCFKPESNFDDDVVLQKPKTPDPLFTYIAVAEKKRVVLPTVLSAKSSSGEENAPNRRQTIGKEKNYSVRRALMSALNHTPLAKKMRYKRKPSKDESPSNLSSSNTTSSSLSSLPFTPPILSSSSTNSSTSTGTQTSGSSSELHLSRSWAINESRVVAQQKQNIGDSRKGHFGNLNMGMCMFFITSLMVLIMWGRCCAIAYTSIGFFVLPNRWRRPCNKGIIF